MEEKKKSYKELDNKFNTIYSDIDKDSRVGWLLTKQFFGPISEEEELELCELMNGSSDN